MKKNSQLINALLIGAGGLLLLTEIIGKEDNVIYLIVGLVLLMFGLYRATNHWAYTKDDHKKEDQDQKD